MIYGTRAWRNLKWSILSSYMPKVPPLQIGDVIEVVTDFDSCVVSPGDRVIHLGKKRWYFTTRFPCHGPAPIYDCNPVHFEEGWLKIVDHLDDLPTDPDELANHPSLRPERRERFLDSLVRHAPAVRKVWQLDLRYKEAKETIDNLVVAILRDEPGLLWDVDLAHHFFWNTLSDHERWWRRERKLTENIGRALDSSVKRLEAAGRIYQPKDTLRWRACSQQQPEQRP